MSQQPDVKLALPLWQVDRVCERFEERWRAAGRPVLEAFLPALPEADRGELLAELLLLEWAYRHAAGESFFLAEYADRFADRRDVVQQAWQRWKERDRCTTTTGLAPAVPAAPAEPAPFDLPGYEQVSLLGRGGMAEVFRAFDPRLKRWVALKRVRLDRATAERLARLPIEAQALARLAHPHIVRVHEYLDRDGQPVLVMEYVSGGTLEQRLDGPLPPAEAARLVAILAWAVHAAHEAGIVHRDLKPANVLMDAPVEGSADNVLGGFPRISDFGLADLLGEPGQTLSGVVLGTPAYMAPEQAQGKMREVGPRTDVWALGVILYRCLTGTLPFLGDSVLDTLERVKTMQFRPVRDVCPEVPEDLAAVCMACLRKEPADRPSAAELAARLASLGPSSRDHQSPELPARRWPWRLAAGLLAATVLAGVVSWLAGAWSKPAGTAQQQPGPLTPPDPAPPRVARWSVQHYRPGEIRKDNLLGTLGVDSAMTRYQDKLLIEVELSRPAYCYLVAFNFDGKEQLLLPCDEREPTAPGDPARRPEPTARLHYPPLPAPGQQQHAFELSDDAQGGLQALLVIASQQPLPPYRDWRGQGEPPWQHMPGGDRVWRGTPEKMVPWSPPRPVVRGRIVPLRGQPPLVELCRWAQGKGGEVEALAFPVNPLEGK